MAAVRGEEKRVARELAATAQRRTKRTWTRAQPKNGRGGRRGEVARRREASGEERPLPLCVSLVFIGSLRWAASEREREKGREGRKLLQHSAALGGLSRHSLKTRATERNAEVVRVYMPIAPRKPDSLGLVPLISVSLFSRCTPRMKRFVKIK